MTAPWVIRRARETDRATIARHRVAMFRDMGELDPAGEAELAAATSRYLEVAIPSAEYVGWIAEDAAGRVVGGGGIQVRGMLPRPGRRGLITREALVLNIYVEPSWRRRGIATALVHQAIRWTTDQGVARLVLHPSQDGRALYERLGFEPTGELRLGGSG